MKKQSWESIGREPEPSWYLDPITAGQKRETHLQLIRKWSEGIRVERILKTDLFEEAYGDDSLLDALFPEADLPCGMDAAFSTARRAQTRHGRKIQALVCDVRSLAVQDCSVDLVVSTSTLDHFCGRTDFLKALSELARVLKSGGLLIITLDNPWNLLYRPLRWFSSGRVSPFPLGYTVSASQLAKDLTAAGLCPQSVDWLLHNPRGISTLLFLGFRKLLRPHAADKMIGGSLRLFELLNRLPTRKITACFLALAARKP
ncbi:MAG: class I SAM-dependent methyltransferase [Acidobacteria bacterium]|nr:class I SAM-dependent methyltransferase [Acidobacteriota bacterium]